MRRTRWLMPVIGLVLAGILAGCAGAVQGTKFGAFKTATASLAQDAQKNYAGVEDLWVGVNLQCLATSNNQFAYGFIYLKEGTPCGKDRLGDPAKRLDARLKALNAIAAYAAMLNTVAGTDYVAGVDSSTAKLTTNLQSLQTSVNKVFSSNIQLQNEITLLGYIVKTAGRLYVNGKRKEALRLLLTEGDAPIAGLCRNLVTDNGEIGNAMETDAKFYVLEAEKTRPKQFERRLEYDRKVWLTYTNAMTSVSSLKAMDKAIALLPEAHAELRASLDAPQKPLPQLEAFMAEVEQALTLWQQIENL